MCSTNTFPKKKKKNEERKIRYREEVLVSNPLPKVRIYWLKQSSEREKVGGLFKKVWGFMISFKTTGLMKKLWVFLYFP